MSIRVAQFEDGKGMRIPGAWSERKILDNVVERLGQDLPAGVHDLTPQTPLYYKTSHTLLVDNEGKGHLHVAIRDEMFTNDVIIVERPVEPDHKELILEWDKKGRRRIHAIVSFKEGPSKTDKPRDSKSEK